MVAYKLAHANHFVYNDPKQLARPLCKEANLSSGAFQKPILHGF